MIIGSDEAGKGDYFGYIVVAAVCCESETLEKLGVRDSKSLSERRIFELEGKIKERCTFSVVSISPTRYNQLHRGSGGSYNLNQIMGWMHAKAINEAAKGKEATEIVIDKFGRDEDVTKHLDEKIIPVFETHAESRASVAAASILARAEFLRKHKLLSRKAGFELPRGSVHVRDALEKLAAERGAERLGEFAKLHFKITKEVMGGRR